MKVFFALIFQIVAYIGCMICGVWALIAFILYLAKDIPFEWWSLWSLIGCIVLSIILLIINAWIVFLNDQPDNPGTYKSNFQKRLEKKQEELLRKDK